MYNYSDIWQPIGSGKRSGYGGTYDAFNSERSPSPIDLVSAFTDVAYACSTLIATSLADIELKLCAQMSKGEAPKVRANSISTDGQKWYRKKAAELHEIPDHLVLDLLASPNPHTSYAELITSTDLYLEIVGRAFWLLTYDDYDFLPVRIDVLPAHLVTTVKNQETGRLVGYQYGDDETGVFYEPKRVIAFRNNAYFDLEAGEGYSPLRSVWQKIQLSFKELSSWEIIVSQMAEPMFIISSKDADTPISRDNADRIAKEFTQRFWRGQKGGPYVNTEALDINMVSYPPKDQSGLTLQDMLKSSVCNAFQVPRSLLDMQDVTQANGNNSIILFQRHCLRPRINNILDKINSQLVSLFDERLFLTAENVVSKDEAMELQKQQLALTAYQAGTLTKNEFRATINVPKVKDGDRFFEASSPLQMISSFSNSDKVIKSAPEDKYEKYPLNPVVEVLKKWFAKQRDYVLSQNKSAEFVTKTWFDLSQFTEDMANDLFPSIMGWYDSSAQKFKDKLGLADDVWRVIQPKLAEAVRAATFRFAESTNATTTLQIEEARKRLREELEAGLVGGDSTVELTKRVQSIFENASEERAFMIADTSRTEAINRAELITAKASGVVKKKVWLADSQACPECSQLNGQSRDLDEPFAVDPRGGPYAVKQSPPFHVSCRCSLVYEV